MRERGNMKVSTILKNTISTRIEIIDNEENNFYTYYIDYTKMYGGTPSGVERWDRYEKHGSPVTIPERVLKRDVNYIDINSVSKALQIRMK